MTFQNRQNYATNEVYGATSANRDQENGRVLGSAIWPSIIPAGQPAAEPSRTGTYRVWTSATHSAGVTTITDAALPDGNDTFLNIVPDAAAVDTDPQDGLCHVVEVLDDTENIYARFPVIAVNSASELEVADSFGVLSGQVLKYRITYNVDRAEHFGHTHDGIDSNAIQFYRRPTYDDSGTLVESDIPVQVFNAVDYTANFTATGFPSRNVYVKKLVDFGNAVNNAVNVDTVRVKIMALAGADLFITVSSTGGVTVPPVNESFGYARPMDSTVTAASGLGTSGTGEDWHMFRIPPTVTINNYPTQNNNTYETRDFILKIQDGNRLWVDWAEEVANPAIIFIYIVGYSLRGGEV
jgi:hypothetical protein